MIPDRERANKELKWAADLNPGPWKEHSLYVAAACESIASRCSHMDRDRAYVLGSFTIQADMRAGHRSAIC